ncbi:hypothetical protein EYF80_063229 [Liparis tanakae]|uniref:Uncharacterized protein n=1 Tax=Liparis tanakae TaxID=230148 RepID=A0A4Z2ECQ2_9TELE|nr:hypothetical protein EYF80_063229 [Liparis tanakae]
MAALCRLSVMVEKKCRVLSLSSALLLPGKAAMTASWSLTAAAISLAAAAYSRPTWAQPSGGSQWEQLAPQSSCRARSSSTERRSSPAKRRRSSRGRKSTYSRENGTWRRPEEISRRRAPSSRRHREAEQQGSVWVSATRTPLLNRTTWSGRRRSRERDASMEEHRESDATHTSIHARRPVPGP